MTVSLVVTFYCACALCCGIWADGKTSSQVTAVPGFTIACDPKVFPMGTILDIDGLGERMCQDIGGGIRGYHIDEFVGHDKHAHSRARQLGRRENVKAVIVHVGGR